MAEARADGGAEMRDAGLDEVLCFDLEVKITSAICAFLHEQPENDGAAEAQFAVPAVLLGMFIEHMISFGKEELTLRAACIALLDSTIDNNRDEIAGLVRARRARDGAGTA